MTFDRSIAGVRLASAAAALIALVGCRPTPPPAAHAFKTPEDAVQALIDATRTGSVDDIVVLFGADGRDLAASGDPGVAARNRETFRVAALEKWRLVDQGSEKVLVVGNEAWPFPIPLTHAADGWRFDTARGREEVLARRIGRNELATIQTCRTYVAAQRLYARTGHDGKPAGLYAAAFRSDPGRQNGLYWEAKHGEHRSPLGDLVAEAAASGQPRGGEPSPFHGYLFKILNSPNGFALVAWPAQYDVTGIMTFVVNHDGVVREKDLGADTGTIARAMSDYPAAGWDAVPDP